MPEKILIVDDELDTLRLVGMMLDEKGIRLLPPVTEKRLFSRQKTNSRT